MPMSLNQLFPQAERDLLIRELTLDSRGVRPGDLFLAVPGGRQDGRAHIADALAKGAAAVAYEAEGAGELPPSDAPLIAVKGWPRNCRRSPGVSTASRAAGWT